jgi:hypothetical protein
MLLLAHSSAGTERGSLRWSASEARQPRERGAEDSRRHNEAGPVRGPVPGAPPVPHPSFQSADGLPDRSARIIGSPAASAL